MTAVVLGGPAQRLDERTLHAILGCFSFGELLSPAHCCRSWYAAAKSEPCRNLLLADGTLPRLRHCPSSALRMHANTVQEEPLNCRPPCDAERLEAVLASPLRAHIATLDNSLLALGQRLRLHHLTRINREFTSLTRLHVALCEYPFRPFLEEGELPAPLPAIFLSSRLTHLELFFYYLHECDVAMVVQTLPTAPLIHTLKLLNLFPSTNLSPLLSLKYLSTLSLSYKRKLVPESQLSPTFPWLHADTGCLDPIASIHTLTSLSINDGKLTLRELACLPTTLPLSLRFFNLAESRLGRGYLSTLHELLPNLTSLVPWRFKVRELPFLASFEHLTSVTFNALAASFPIGDHHLVGSLLQCPSLTHIGFNQWCIHDLRAWTDLFEGLPKLCGLSLGIDCPRSLEFLTLPAVAVALTTVTFLDCGLATDQFVAVTRGLPNCTSCTIHLDAFPDVTPQQQLDAFNSRATMPLLRFLHLEAPQKRPRTGVRAFIWDEIAGKNVDRFRRPAPAAASVRS